MFNTLYKRFEMYIKDAIGTEENLTLQANWRQDEAVINEFNCIEQIYKTFQAPFELKTKKLFSEKIVYF